MPALDKRLPLIMGEEGKANVDQATAKKKDSKLCDEGIPGSANGAPSGRL